MATFRWDAANPGIANGLTACGLVANGTTDNTAALRTFFNANPGAIVVIEANTDITFGDGFDLRREPNVDILGASALSSGFTRLPWNNTGTRLPCVSNKPDATRNDTATRVSAHLSMRGIYINAKGYDTAHASADDLDQHSSNVGWNAGFLMVGLAFDATSVIETCTMRGARTFGWWFVNCTGMRFDLNSTYGKRPIATAITLGYVNGDGLHLNNCASITGTRNYFEGTDDDAIAINVDPLTVNVPGSPGNPDYDHQQNIQNTPWYTGGCSLGSTDITLTRSEFYQCASGVRVLSMYSSPQTNIRITQCRFRDHRGSILHTNAFGTSPGTQIYNGLVLDDWYIEATMANGDRVNDNGYLAKTFGTYPSGCSVKNWTRITTGVAYADALRTLWVSTPVAGNLDLSGYTFSGESTVEDRIFHCYVSAQVSGVLKIGRCRAVRRGATFVIPEAVYLLTAPVLGGVDATGGNYVEGLSGHCATDATSFSTPSFDAGSGNVFVAPSCLLMFSVSGTPTTTGDYDHVGDLAATALFTDTFDTDLSAWTGNTNGSVAGGELTLPDSTRLYRTPANSGRAIMTAKAVIGPAGTGTDSFIGIFASGNATNGAISSFKNGSSFAANGTTELWSDYTYPSRIGGYTATTGVAAGSEVQGLVFAGRKAFFSQWQMTGGNRRCTSILIDVPSDLTAGTRMGFATLGSAFNAGVKARDAIGYQNIVTASTVSAATVVGPAGVVQGRTVQYGASVTGTGAGKDAGVWSVVAGVGDVDPFTGLFTAPAAYTAGATSTLRFIPIVNPAAYADVTIALLPAVTLDRSDTGFVRATVSLAQASGGTLAVSSALRQKVALAVSLVDDTTGGVVSPRDLPIWIALTPTGVVAEFGPVLWRAARLLPNSNAYVLIGPGTEQVLGPGTYQVFVSFASPPSDGAILLPDTLTVS